MSKHVYSWSVAAMLVVVGCASSANDPVAKDEAPLIGDIASMVQQPDGTFTVTCKDGHVESGVTSEMIAAQLVCGGAVGPITCVDGSSLECDDSKEHWTGSKCCVEGPVTCVDGSSLECDDSKEHWTGSKCCVEGPVTCVDGSSLECDDSKEHWTGSKCCVER